MMSLIKLINICVLLILPGLIQSLNICGDWVQYSSTKCIMVIEKKATEEEAIKSCGELDKESSLLTVHSRDEQEFLNKLLHKYNSISIYAWLGMKYTNGSYKWLDYSDSKFTNWEDDAIRDGTEPCVQMSLVRSSLGKWLDEPCKRLALIVCQKKQMFTLNTLRTAFESMEKAMKTLEKSTIPLGFLYTQLPDQSAPEVIWPHMNWTEVTEQYAGLFFRAEGNSTEPFGKIQQANQTHISTISDEGFHYINNNQANPQKSMKVSTGWNSLFEGAGFKSIDFYVTSGDVRPVNTAVRIWKRIE